MKPTKILGRKNYGSIPHLSFSKLGPGDHYLQAGQERIILERVRDKHDRIYVSEKYDGTNVGIAKVDGKIIAVQRKGYDCITSPYEMHKEFAKWVKEREGIFREFLAEGERIVGEWLWQASGIKYKLMGEPFVAFDYVNQKNERYPYSISYRLLTKIRIQFVRILHAFNRPADFQHCLDKLNSRDIRFYSESKPEGMVFRVERKGKFDFIAKWVRGDFEPGKFLPGIGISQEAEIVINTPI